MNRITLDYRGPLTSCNYTCDYCPFNKDWEEPAVLEADRRGLERFVAWAEGFDGPPLHIRFTPWGEALVRAWYREAFVALSRMPSVAQVAVQTNLSMNLSFLDRADRSSAGLWTTWHPPQTDMDRFLTQCARLDDLGIRYSVGVVGLHEHLDAIEAMRVRLRPDVYLWVNAFQRVQGYYSDAQRDRIRAIDPHFDDNRAHDSHGRRCFAGETHFTVDGEGTVRSCHFVERVLGNLYEDPLDAMLGLRTCPNTSCRCHIGYTHLAEPGLYAKWGDGLVARIPASG